MNMATSLSRKRYLATPNGKAKHQAYTLRWRAAHRLIVLAAYRKHDLKRHYDMTPKEWDEMFEAQGRACAACHSIFPGRKTGHWCTDHDHNTGVVRGILCNGCNAAIGHAKDDPKRLRALATYLERKV
jgi:nitrate/TMAO reductase-like tetraheme cytochrome c subunit